jgi:pimeloyl-ACP methyl ester carboxylesterase
LHRTSEWTQAPRGSCQFARYRTWKPRYCSYARVRDTAAISPDNWNVDLRHLTRDGNPEIQLALFYSYGTNPPLYPEWQAYFREHQPPTLSTWGKNDYIFPKEGAHPYKRDLTNLEFHLLDTGHFALEEDGAVIAELIREFLRKNAPAEAPTN